MIKEGHRKSIQLRTTPQVAEKICKQLTEMVCITGAHVAFSLEIALLGKDATYEIKVTFKNDTALDGLRFFIFSLPLLHGGEE